MPKSARHRYLDAEVILSPAEAEAGGVLPIHVPAYRVCPFCEGSGSGWFSRCLACDGAGAVETPQVVRLRIPDQVRDGAVYEVPLPAGGVRLRVRVRVDPFGGA